MRCLAVLLTGVLVLASAPQAIELPTQALVTVIEGIDVAEITPLNFGVLARSNGTVTVSAVDGSHVDASFIVYDGTAISQGVFEVQSIAGATVELTCTPGVIPDGLTLDSFTVEWAESGEERPVPDTRVLAASLEVMKLGASLTITSAAMPAPLGAVSMPYTVEVAFP